MDVTQLYLLRKDALARMFFLVGMVVAYVTSLHPWFVWHLKAVAYFLSAGLLVCSMFLSEQSSFNLYKSSTFFLPWIGAALMLSYDLFLGDPNFNGYVATLFHVVIFLAIFRVDSSLFRRLSTILAKMLAIFMVFSIFFFILYLLGFSLPHSNIEHPSGNYSFTNYYFFLLDDRFMNFIIPRFHSIVLEPGHLGSALAVLLMSQCGHLSKWYNLVLIFTTLITMSLAAYVFLFVGSFLTQWMRGRQILKWILVAILVLVSSAIVAINYNDGENMINQMIMLRLEVEDGELSGDNRVSDTFQQEYESFLQSSDLLLGRGLYEEKELKGNSGYKLYLYEKGLLGVLLVVFFYGAALLYTRHKRALLSAALIAVLLFIVRADPLWYFDFLGVYMIAHQFDDVGPVTFGKTDNV